MSKKKVAKEKVTRMPLTSADVNDERMERLRELYPEAFAEGKIDLDRLKGALGEEVDEGRERYGLSWAGKADAIRAIQVPSIGTLIPSPEQSVDFDTSGNLFIEGDNLEVLKLLQKSYHGRVKMIYIDPPYNTGNEFIYPDNFRDGLQEYLRFTGQVDEEGTKLSTNRETSGRYHSNWLSMMYPRLFLARNLLRDDGVIFVSIDDHEVHNLRLLMNEIFGESNFIQQLVWKKKYTGGKHAKYYADLHEYVLVYGKVADTLPAFSIPRPDFAKKKFKLVDDYFKTRGKYYIRPLKSNLAERKTLIYPIELPDNTTLTTQWIVAEDTFKRLLSEGRIEFKQKRNGEYQVYRKYYQNDYEGTIKPDSIIDFTNNNEAKRELKKLFKIEEGRDNVFYTVKPTKLIRHFIETCGAENDLILDFFAGSGSTAQAILDHNLENNDRCKYILVQLPEKIDKGEWASIADLCKERIRRTIYEINRQSEGQLDIDSQTNSHYLGFKVFKLSSSNFKIWDAAEAPKDGEELAEQLKLYADHLLPDRSEEDILFELLLKAGFPLTAGIEKKTVKGKTVYSIEGGRLLICLEERVTAGALRGMMDLKPQQIICLDNAFGGNDQLKTNTVLESRDREIEFRTI